MTVLRERDGWAGVRVGVGPYLVGWVRAERLATHAGVGAPKRAIAPEVLDPWRGGRPSRGRLRSEVRATRGRTWSPRPKTARHRRCLRAAVVRPVWRVAAGTRARVDGAVVAILAAPGHAVELERDGDAVTVLGAVDEDAAVRGEVDATALFAPPE